jgi:osmotically-inducible protein OsmY
MMQGMKTLSVAVAAALMLQGCAAVVVGGAVATVAMVDDKRTSGTYIEDQNIELKASSRLGEAKLGEGVNASFTSFNRKLLITGEAPNEELKARVAAIAKDVPEVRDVVNEMAVAGVTSWTTRSDDTLLTTKVKTRLAQDDGVHSNHVKVVSSKGVVYLMGILPQKEADIAAQVAATTSGVQKVVKLFEYEKMSEKK